MKHKHHKIPTHAGGTNDPENIETLTPEDHAEAHKKLFEEHGTWQDEVAWKGLAGLIDGDKCQEIAMIEGGRKGSSVTNAKFPVGTRGYWNLGKHGNTPFNEGNQLTAKTYTLIDENGLIFEVHGLSKWCREHDMNIKSFHKQVVERKRSHKGYKLID